MPRLCNKTTGLGTNKLSLIEIKMQPRGRTHFWQAGSESVAATNPRHKLPHKSTYYTHTH